MVNAAETLLQGGESAIAISSSNEAAIQRLIPPLVTEYEKLLLGEDILTPEQLRLAELLSDSIRDLFLLTLRHHLTRDDKRRLFTSSLSTPILEILTRHQVAIPLFDQIFPLEIRHVHTRSRRAPRSAPPVKKVIELSRSTPPISITQPELELNSAPQALTQAEPQVLESDLPREVGQEGAIQTLPEINPILPSAELAAPAPKKSFHGKSISFHKRAPSLVENNGFPQPDLDPIAAEQFLEQLSRTSFPSETENAADDMSNLISLHASDLKHLGGNTLLTAQEEQTLGRIVVAGLQYWRLSRKNKLSNPTEDVIRLVTNCEKARQIFVVRNYRLVLKVAKRYAQDDEQLLHEYVGEGHVGLLRAIDKFDPERGRKFSTYATWWIRQSISRYIAQQSADVHIPVHAVDGVRKINQAIRVFWHENHSYPAVEDIKDIVAKLFPRSKKTMFEAWIAMRKARSFEEEVGDDGDDTLGDFVASNDEHTETITNMSGFKEGVRASLLRSHMKPIHRFILCMRHGIQFSTDELAKAKIDNLVVINNQPQFLDEIEERSYTLEEIAKACELSRERIRQLENEAKKRLRPLLERKGLRQAVEDLD